MTAGGPRPASDAVCKICDGGLANECACFCGAERWDKVVCCNQTVPLGCWCPGCPHERPKCTVCSHPLVKRRRLYSTVYDDMCVNEDCVEHHNRVASPQMAFGSGLSAGIVPIPVTSIPGYRFVPNGTGSGDFSIGGQLWPGLSKLIEESGEVIQVAGKLIGSEGRVDHWSGDLRKMLVEEIGDLMAAIEFFVDHNDLPQHDIRNRRVQKYATFLRWHREGLERRNG